jgi:hypothetical protein
VAVASPLDSRSARYRSDKINRRDDKSNADVGRHLAPGRPTRRRPAQEPAVLVRRNAARGSIDRDL